MTNIDKTYAFLIDEFTKSEYFRNHEMDRFYRLEHILRVANIGKRIAEAENLNVEACVIGCLLHDLSYIKGFNSDEDWLNHGRDSAKLARDFVYTLDIENNLKEEILFGIAIHVDDKADFPGERTVLAETIGESDNIDRFDKYRLYEGLLSSGLEKMSLQEKIEFCQKKCERLKNLKKVIHKSKTSNEMWQANLDYNITYFQGLLEQFSYSSKIV